MWDAIVSGSWAGGLGAGARTVLWAGSVGLVALALALPARAQSRGELLYSTHCIACHTTQMHWRDKKLATDWNSLKAQVRAWQSTARLAWSEDDIVAVTHHLNDNYYRFAQPAQAYSTAIERAPVP